MSTYSVVSESDSSILSPDFITLLNNSTHAQKKAMLLVIRDSLNAEFDNKQSNRIDFNNYVDAVKDFVPDDFLDDALMAEVESMGICRNSTKPLTQWLSCDDRPYCFSDKPLLKHDSKNLRDYPAICQLMDLVNMDNRTTQDANSALVIVYNNNQARIDFHDDGESLIESSSSISTVTFGTARSVDFCDHTLRPRVAQHSIECGNHDMLIMKPGCQKALVHRVSRGSAESSSSTSGLRVVISFRKITEVGNNSFDLEVSFDSPVSTINTANQSAGSVSTLPESLVSPLRPPKQYVTIIAGDSFIAGLDIERLGRKGKKTVINLAKGGSTISDVTNQFESYFMSHSSAKDTPVVEKVIVCVGTNDIRNCRENGVRHLKRPLICLIEKIKLLFPVCNIWFQTLIPLTVQNQFSITNVNQFNKLLFEVCSYMRVYYLNVFSYFLQFDRERKGLFRNEYYFINSKNIHLNKLGLGLLARSYLRIIHSSRFNPLGY